jgi:hypothetical protein
MAGNTISTVLIDSTYSLIISNEVTHKGAEMLSQKKKVYTKPQNA